MKQSNQMSILPLNTLPIDCIPYHLPAIMDFLFPTYELDSNYQLQQI